MWNLSIESGRFKVVRPLAELSRLRKRRPRGDAILSKILQDYLSSYPFHPLNT
jgi:hypothetical protein